MKWFEDGQLNACYNALDRHILAGKGDKVAIIYEADEAGGESNPPPWLHSNLYLF